MDSSSFALSPLRRRRGRTEPKEVLLGADNNHVSNDIDQNPVSAKTTMTLDELGTLTDVNTHILLGRQ